MNGGRVGILGLTYKSGVDIVDESQGIELVREHGSEFSITAFDPEVTETAADVLETYELVSDPEVLVSTVDTVVVTNMDGAYDDPDLFDGRPVSLVDPWRLFDDVTLDAVEYVPIGIAR